MSQNKKNITDDELLKALEDNEDISVSLTHSETKPYFNANTIEHFLNIFNITPGNDPVSLKVFFMIYRKITDSPKKFLEFKQELNKLFVIKQKTLLIDKSVVKLTDRDMSPFTETRSLNNALNTKSERLLTNAFSLLLIDSENKQYFHVNMLYKQYRSYCRRLKIQFTAQTQFEIYIMSNYPFKRTNNGVFVNLKMLQPIQGSNNDDSEERETLPST